MFLSSLRYFNVLSAYIFINLKAKSKVSSGYYANQHTVLIISSAIQFFMKFFSVSNFFQSFCLVDIVVCDYKNTLNRFGVTYLLCSHIYSARIYVRLLSDVFLFIKSLSGLFRSATWLEREVYDMFGLFFFGNEDLRRILTDYGFNGFPLQKDFPLTGFVEKQYILSENTIISQQVVLPQEFRFTV